MAREGKNLSQGLSAQAFPYLYGGQQNQLNRQQQGIGQAQSQAQLPGQVLGQAGQVGGQGMNMLGQLLNMGGTQRGIAGEQMGEEYNKWQMQQAYNNPWINALGSLQGSAPQMDYMSQQEGPGMFSQLAGGLGSLMGTPGGVGNLMGNIGDLAGGVAGGVGGALGGLGGLFGGGAPSDFSDFEKYYYG